LAGSMVPPQALTPDSLNQIISTTLLPRARVHWSLEELKTLQPTMGCAKSRYNRISARQVGDFLKARILPFFQS
jgi:hypothetical protein